MVTAVSGSATDRRVSLYYETGGAPAVLLCPVVGGLAGLAKGQCPLRRESTKVTIVLAASAPLLAVQPRLTCKPCSASSVF